MAHKENYKCHRKQTADLAKEEKRKYYSDKIDSSKGKMMFSAINQLLDLKQDILLPDSNDDKELVNAFMNYFEDKIAQIRSKFDTNLHSIDTVAHNNVINNLTYFESTTTDEILQIVSSYGLKCSPDDPIPAQFLKENLDFFIPIWTKLVNLSLAQGSMESLKSAILHPSIKDLDAIINKDILKNYRPVSNLVIISKVIERVVRLRLIKHMTEN